ncbi:Cytochrome P450 3A24 [Holothuria leucospilota]|uniref:Cytochrome P450 3A24 n=1 Tax=Holothuria leucospilota TaxID=206669 RepID=A0A9Q1BCC1_HOLLE|nr:Cytochrome P450 3A24 [Holothuria leucospilota]
MLKDIMISQFSAFPNHVPQPFNEKPFNKAVTVLNDGHWKAVRNTLSPAFSGSKMKQLNKLSYCHGNASVCLSVRLSVRPTLVKKAAACRFFDHSFTELVKVVPHTKYLIVMVTGSRSKVIWGHESLYGSYSMDVVATTFFGMQIDSQKNPDDPFVKHAKEAFNFGIFSVKCMLIFFVPCMRKIFQLLGIKVANPAVGEFFQDVISRALELRKTENIKRKDMLQLMIDAHKLDSTEEGENGELVNENIDGDTSSHTHSKAALSEDEIMANAFTFFLAGYETTNTALCMTSYLLATNKEIQEKLIQEVDKFAPRKEDVTYELVGQMEYLDGVVREALRMYPPAAVTDRINDKKDIELNGFTIPKGFSVLVPIYAIHHDPDVWEEPEEFRPERFFKQNRANIHPVSWLPFGDGPRSCIGLRLALMEIRFALVRMLQEFKFETCSETEIPPVLSTRSAFLSPPNGVRLQVVPRKKTE